MTADGETEVAAVCGRCGLGPVVNYCANCGADQRRRSPLYRALRQVFGPVSDYIALLPALVKPRWLVDDVRAGAIGTPELIGFSLAAAGVSAIIGFWFPGIATFKSLPPVLDEVADAAFEIVGSLVFQLPLYFALQRRGHAVPWRQFAAVAASMVALVYPLINLADGILLWLYPKSDYGLLTFFAQMPWFVQAYARLFGRSRRTVAGWMAVVLAGNVVVIAILYALVAAAFGTAVTA
jgi:hypothetical protein